MAIELGDDLLYEIDLDLHNNAQFPSVPIKQYDQNAGWIVATIWDNGSEYIIPEGTVAQFACTKPSGLGILNQAFIENNKVYYKITLQTTVEYGNFEAEIRLGKTSSSVIAYSTPKFNLIIEKSALQDGTVLSANEINVLTELIAEATDVINEGNTVIIEATEAISAMNTLNETVTEAEAIRVSNEETRVEHDAVRPVWHYVTEDEYDALPDEDKNDPLNMWRITDSVDLDITDVLSDLLAQINTALSAVEEITTTINNINDSSVNSIQTWSSNKIAKNIRTSKFTATSTATTIPHNLNYNPLYDDMLVTYNGVVLEKDENYTDSSDMSSIVLSGWSINSGESVRFRLYKYAKYV